jgi:UTP-glucose-1-phosphate uridylyltransferase
MAEKTLTDVSAGLKAVQEAIEKPAATSAADVEAATENSVLKTKIFKALDEICAKNTTKCNCALLWFGGIDHHLFIAFFVN